MFFKLTGETDENTKVVRLLMACTALGCIVQLLWLAPKCLNRIDYDGMAYTGIARHIREGHFHSAINAFRSPLVSWLIAALSFFSSDYLHVGKFVSICTFLLCVVLLYVFAWQLWHSQVVAALAALLFTLGRGLSATAIAFVTPDFLFAALVLVYFIVLLRCLRIDHSTDWLLLGAIHGLAFLAKAFALPWLGLCTVVALSFSSKTWKERGIRLSLAALLPLIAATGWATVLHSKYGIYTTGSQFKANFLQWTIRPNRDDRDSPYVLLRDNAKETDEYVVDDPMPPYSWAWSFHVPVSEAVPKLLLAEKRNVPKVLKELIIVETPGVLLGFMIILAILVRNRHLYSVEWRVATVIAASTVSLTLVYSMMVFDRRYLFPLIPLLLAVGARYLVAGAQFDDVILRRICIGLVAFGMCVSLTYSSSPFRFQSRDFQEIDYLAGAILKRHGTSETIVSIGSGPFAEHGVGWEAGYNAAYFGGEKLIASLDSLPNSSELSILGADVSKAIPDAIVVWGRPTDSEYAALKRSLTSEYPRSSFERILDPVLGEVGGVLFTGN